MNAREMIAGHGYSSPTVLASGPGTGGGNGMAGLLQPLSEVSSGLSDLRTGQLSLLMLDTMALALIGFYIWTRKVQAGA